MIPNKSAIKSSFSGAAATYDCYSDLQSMSAAELLRFVEASTLLPLKTILSGASRVLDVGCGTGHLTSELLNNCSSSKLFAIDIAHPMVKRLRGKSASAMLAASDFDAMPFPEKTFDVVASNLAYQWSVDKRSSFAEARRVLTENGQLFIATLGAETLKELRECYPDRNALVTFDTVDEIRASLNGAGLKDIVVESRIIRRGYAGFLGLIATLHKTGAVPRTGLTVKPHNPFALRKAQREYDAKYKDKSNGIYATYELVFISAGRKD